MIVSGSTLRIGPYLFYIEKFITQFKTTEKIIGHSTCFPENDNLPLWRGPAAKKKPITHKIMRSTVGMRNAILVNDLKVQIVVVFLPLR